MSRRPPEVQLADVERRAGDSPDTFAIPPRERREQLWPGDLAKVVVARVGDLPCGERLWVRVDALLAAEGRYHGVVVSFPVTDGISSGDEVEFGPEHVADVYGAEDSMKFARRAN